VPLVVFREAFPEVWQSVKAISELHRGACPVRGETVDP
jgi:predicted sugar kinase